MSITASNTLLALIIVSLGLLGIILSFLVVEKKKANIALVLSGVIIFVGLIQFGSQWIARFRWERRMSALRSEGNFDIDKLKERLKQPGMSETGQPAAPQKK